MQTDFVSYIALQDVVCDTLLVPVHNLRLLASDLVRSTQVYRTFILTQLLTFVGA
jgi:hypothetical protein